jgi:hypothetical protein
MNLRLSGKTARVTAALRGIGFAEDYAAEIRSSLAKWQKVIRAANIRAD